MPKRSEKPVRTPVAAETPALLADQVAELKRVFPEAVTEGKVDFEKLKATLGEIVDERPERYSFTWAGKRDCIRLLQTPSLATLVPCPEESIDWDATNNVFIEGENLEVLKLLYKAYYGRIKMIYIDPPYNTGKDFIYPDNFADPLDSYLKLTGQKDAKNNILESNPETSGRYHSAWLSMVYPRLFVARQLLREDGMIFISIDDHEVENLRLIMNEIFGEENFLASIIWQHSIQPKGYVETFSLHHNYLLCYQKSPEFTLGAIERTPEHNVNYSNPDNDPNGPWRAGDVRNALYRRHLIFDIVTPSGKVIKPPPNGWRWSKETIAAKIKSGEIMFSKDETRIIRKIYLKNVQGRAPETIWFGKDAGTTRSAAEELKELFAGNVPFDTPKPSALVRRMLQIGTERDSDDIILDFFAGSCPTAQAVLEANRADGGGRRLVVAQLPEPVEAATEAGRAAAALDLKTISEVGKERIRRVIAKMKKEDAGKLLTGREGKEDLGFKVFKLAESNYASWRGVAEAKPAGYVEQMKAFADTLVSGWKPDNVIYEVALKEAGYGLNCRIEEVKPPMNADKRRSNSKSEPESSIGVNRRASAVTIFRVTDPDKEQFFFICLDDKIRLVDLRFLNLTREVLFVCRDKALDDEAAANLALQCRLRTI